MSVHGLVFHRPSVRELLRMRRAVEALNDERKGRAERVPRVEVFFRTVGASDGGRVGDG